MGASTSSIGSAKRLPEEKKERTLYVQNFNNEGDSDYDDELDSQVEDDGRESDRSILNNAGLHGDGKNMFDDLEKSTLLDKT